MLASTPRVLTHPLHHSWQQSAPAAPSTPPGRQIDEEKLWSTPRDRNDVKAQVDDLHRDLEGCDCHLRDFGRRVGKAIIQRNTLVASLETQRNFFPARAESQEVTGWRAVNMTPNEAFPSIKETVEAKSKAEQAAERHSKHHGLNPENDSLKFLKQSRRQ